MGVARQHQLEAPARVVLRPLRPVGHQNGAVLPIQGGGHRLQLLPPPGLAHRGIVNAAELHRLSRRRYRHTVPRQHHRAPFLQPGLHLVHPPRPELVIAGDIIGGPYRRQGLHRVQRPLLRHPGLVVHDVAAQQYQVGGLLRHRIQQLPLALPIGAGVQIGEHRQPHRAGESPALHRIGAYQQAGVQTRQQKHPGCRQSGGQHSFRPLFHAFAAFFY